MKLTKADIAKEKCSLKRAIRKSLTRTVTKNSRVATPSPHIEVKPEYVSISKYIRGVSLGDWTDAKTEKSLFQKALGQDDGTRGGVFVPDVLNTKIIPLLQENAKVRNLPGVQKMAFKGPRMNMGKQDSAATISWGTEGGTISEDTGLEYGEITLEKKKAVCLYKISHELLQNAGVGVDGLVTDALVKALSLEEDKVILEGTGGTEPQGIFYEPRVRSTDLSGNISVDDIREAMYQARLSHANISSWIAHPRMSYDFGRLSDAEGRPIFASPTGGAEGQGTVTKLLDNVPVVYTNQIATTNMPSSNETYMIGADWSNLLIGEDPGIRIDRSEHADFTTDQVTLKLVKYVGKVLLQPGTFVVIKGITSP